MEYKIVLFPLLLSGNVKALIPLTKLSAVNTSGGIHFLFQLSK